MVRFTRMQTFIQFGKFPFKLLGVMILLRLIDLFLVQSSYVPDEYWQSLEVAHKKAFGYGYLTWEWGKGIRSYFYVSLVYLLYSALKLLQLDSPELIILLPRIFQGLLCAVADVYFIRWVYEKRSGQFSWGMLSWMTAFFISYCSTRTLINTFEMNLSVIGLYYYPMTPKSSNITFAIIISLLCFIRPTAAILWLPLVLIAFANAKHPLRLIAGIWLPVGLVVAVGNIALDTYFHDSLIFTPYNFFRLNIVENINSFYGTHNYFWYWYAGLPVVLGIQVFPFYLRSLLRLSRSNFFSNLHHDLEAQMIFTVLWTVTILSIVPHKEFRFLMPVAPMAIFVSSGVLGRWSVTAKKWLLYAIGLVLISSHVGMLIFLGRFHNAGPLNAMTYLRNDIGNSSDVKLLFLAPCHSFPLHSHLHKRVPARFLTCTPNFHNESAYIDETEIFYNNPSGWLRSQYATLQPCTLPTHIIKYDSLNVTNFLAINNYTLADTVFNSFYFPNNTGQYVQIYKRRGRVC